MTGLRPSFWYHRMRGEALSPFKRSRGEPMECISCVKDGMPVRLAIGAFVLGLGFVSAGCGLAESSHMRQERGESGNRHQSSDQGGAQMTEDIDEEESAYRSPHECSKLRGHV